MAFPCRYFMADAGIQEEFDALCARAGLTRLVKNRVPQYQTLTAVFINSFRFYPESDFFVFQIYERLLTMPMSTFCEALGLPDRGEKIRKNSQTTALKTLLDSFCNTEVRSTNRQKISNILFPHLSYFAYYIAIGVLARDNTSNTSSPDTAIMANALSGEPEYHVGTLIARRLAANGNKGDLFGGIYAMLTLQFLEGTPHPDEVAFPFISFDLAAMKRHKFVTLTSELDILDYILRFEDGEKRLVRIP